MATDIRPDEAHPGTYRLSGRLGFDTASALLAQGMAVFGKAPASGPLVLDLSEVSRVDSAGLALLIEWVKMARRREQPMVFRNVPEQLVAMAAVVGVDRILFPDPA